MHLSYTRPSQPTLLNAGAAAQLRSTHGLNSAQTAFPFPPGIDPAQELQPSVWAIKHQLMLYAHQGLLDFYIDLHAHANKKGVFLFGESPLPMHGDAPLRCTAPAFQHASMRTCT